MGTEDTAPAGRVIDENLIDIVIEANSNLVRHVLGKYFPKYQYDEDMFQIGLIGLWKACLTYDPSKSEFSTFASVCIMNRIRHEIRTPAKSRPPGQLLSLDEPAGPDPDSGRTLADVIPDDRDMFSLAEYDLGRAIGALTPTEREILEMRAAGWTTTEIGKAYGKSQAWGSRSVSAVQKKIRRTMLE